MTINDTNNSTEDRLASSDTIPNAAVFTHGIMYQNANISHIRGVFHCVYCFSEFSGSAIHKACLHMPRGDTETLVVARVVLCNCAVTRGIQMPYSFCFTVG